MLDVIKDVTYCLESELWSGALRTMKVIQENNKYQDLIFLLEDLFPEPVDIVAINDLLWFDTDFIFEQLNIKADD